MDESGDETEKFLGEIAKAIPDVEHQSHVYKIIDTFLKGQTDGLKTKNAELIASNQELKAKLPDGLDSESIKSMLEQLSGKSLEDYGNSIREESAAQVTELSAQLTESETRALALDRQYQSTLINLELRQAAEKARVRPEAINDFVALHSKNFALADGKAMAGEQSATEYVAGVLRESYYWRPESRGAGARGSKAVQAGFGRGDDFDLQAAAAAGDQKEYRRIREKQRERK